MPGLAAGILLGWGPLAAITLGGITYISSSGVIAKLLGDLHRLANRETPVVLSILVIEDLAMAAYLPVVTVLLAGGSVAGSLLPATLALAAVAAVLTAALRYGTALNRLVFSPSDEVLLLKILGITFLVAGVAHGLQVSAAVGASWSASPCPARPPPAPGPCSPPCVTCSPPCSSSSSACRPTRRPSPRWRSPRSGLRSSPRSPSWPPAGGRHAGPASPPQGASGLARRWWHAGSSPS